MFYHLSRTENKELILENGLRAMGSSYVYLAANILDTFLLAPPLKEYMFLYRTFYNLYSQSNAYMFEWKQHTFDVCIFSVDAALNKLRKNKQPDKHRIEKKLFGITEGQDRCVFEYVTDQVPKEAIIAVTDYKLPYLYLDGMSPMFYEYWDKIYKMKRQGHTLAQGIQYIRENYMLEYPPLVIPEDKSV